MSSRTGEIKVSEELANNLDYCAYQDALRGGQFQGMEPGTWVVFREGNLAGSGMDRDALFRELDEKGLSGGFAHQVGVPERVVNMGGPRVVSHSCK